MASQLEPAPGGSDDDLLASMVAVADLPSLLAALAHVSGEPGLPGDDLYLDPTKHHEPQGGWTPEQQARARVLALRTLIELRDAGWPRPPEPTAEAVRPIISWMMGTATTDDYLALLLEELGGFDSRSSSADVDCRRGCARPGVSGRGGRCRHVGAAGRASLASGGTGCGRVREERGSRRHVAAEHLPGLPRRCRQPPLLLFVRAARRLAATLLDAARAARVLQALCGGLRRPPVHRVLDDGRGSGIRRRICILGRAHRRRRRPNEVTAASTPSSTPPAS